MDTLIETIRQLPPSAGNTVVVAIDGCGGAGKSTLAAKLASAFADSAIVHTDDFASWDNPVDWWPRLLEQVLVPLSRGERGHYQRYDWTERRLAEWHDVSAKLVILEGVTATREEFRRFLAFKIWVDCPRELRLQRGLERDGTGAEGLWQDWMAAEDQYCLAQQPRERADLVLEGW
ncbi:MAG: uridine kinase [Fimbriimonas sp.]